MLQKFANNIHYTGKPWMLLVRPTLFTGLVVLVLVLWLSSMYELNFWSDLPQSKGATAGTYCEKNQLDKLIRQPSNTWSNLGYLFYGFICFELAWNDRKNRPVKKNLITMLPWASILYGFSFAYLCFGSFLFHASLTRMGQHWDMAATYLLTSMPIIVLGWQISLSQMRFKSILDSKKWLRTSNGVLTVVFALTATAFYLLKWHLNSGFAMPALILTTMLLVGSYMAFKKDAKFITRYAVMGLIFVIAAFVIWYQDKAKIWCDPDSIVQGHAAWHFLTGLGALFIYFWMRSETPLESSAD